MVDNCILDQNDIKNIKYTVYEEYIQTELDNKINELFKTGICKMRKDYKKETIINSLRQMYSENRVGCFLEKNKHKYKGVIVCGPDYYIINKLKLNVNYFSNKNTVYTTKVNDAMGITNGFYIGNIESLIPILKRFNKIKEYLPTNKDYEYILKKSFDKNNIICKKIDLLFVKISATKKIACQGIMRNKEYNNIINNIEKQLLNK